MDEEDGVYWHLWNWPLHLGCDPSGALVGEKLGGEYEVHGGYDYVQICSVHGVCSRLMSVVDGLSVQTL